MSIEQYNPNQSGTSLDRIHEFFQKYAERIKKKLNNPSLDPDDRCSLQGGLVVAMAVVEIVEIEQETNKI